MKKLIPLMILAIFSLIANAQTFVSTSPENKNVILEEFTGIYCVWCPAGHLIGQQLHDANPNDVFLINIHTGGFATPGAGDPDFRVDPIGANIASQSNLSGYPAGTVNRHLFSMTQNGGTAMSRSDWSAASNQILAQSSPVNVGAQASIDMATNVLTVDVEVYYTGSQTVNSNMLNVAVLQNNVEGPQTGGASNNPGSMNSNGTYNHNHMLRHMMTGQWGEQISNISPGSLYSNTFTWTIPPSVNGVILDPTNISIIAFVAEGQQEILSGTEATPNVIFANSFDAYCMSANANDAICGSSTDINVTFRNYGNQNLTSLDINYSINGGSNSTYPWTGNLAPAGTETIIIPGVTFTPQANNNISVSTSNPNGNTDQNSSNDNTSTSFSQYDAAGQVQSGVTVGNITINVTTDQYGSSENSWELMDDNGNIIASVAQGSMSSSAPQAPVNANIQANTCYSFKFYDSYGDGICCSYGQGSYTVTDASGTVIAGGGSNTSFSNFNERADFFKTGSSTPAASWNCDNGNCIDPGDGSGIYGSYTQCMSACNSTSINDDSFKGISIFPNPAKNIINIEGTFETIQLYDISGKLLVNTNYKTINIQNLSEGIYLLHIVTTDELIVEKVTISK
ncbi:MAG: hypothetical protein CMP51_04390 [Flavobacteriales bacterium]|nr:hypothetical protein [Flavobacteriales bacterium]